MKDLQAEPEVAEALRVVLSSGRPERFKVLTVACPQDHVLGRVYRTSLGLVLVAQMEGVKAQQMLDLPTGTSVAVPVRGARAQHLAGFLGSYMLQCRCCTVYVRDTEMDEAIAAGRKRLRVSDVV